MCLLIKTTRTAKDYARKLKQNGSLVCYKVYTKDYFNLYSVHFSAGAIKAGWIKSNRNEPKLMENEADAEVVNQGIHVYFTKRAAQRSSMNYYGRRTVEVVCYDKDLVGVGTEGWRKYGAVFMKVWLSKKEKDKALKQ